MELDLSADDHWRLCRSRTNTGLPITKQVAPCSPVQHCKLIRLPPNMPLAAVTRCGSNLLPSGDKAFLVATAGRAMPRERYIDHVGGFPSPAPRLPLYRAVLPHCPCHCRSSGVARQTRGRIQCSPDLGRVSVGFSPFVNRPHSHCCFRASPAEHSYPAISTHTHLSKPRVKHSATVWKTDGSVLTMQ